MNLYPPDRWRAIEAHFSGVLDLSDAERAAYLKRSCATDPALRSALESLLQADREAEDFLTALDAPRAAALLESVEEEGEPVGAIGPYTLLSRLGRGGMGVVYLAHDPRLERPVALKLLAPHLGRDAEARRRFTEEARAASAIEHPHIATIYEIGETPEGQLYIAMAFCEGQTLRERLQRGPFEIEEAIRIALQLADALAAAHRRGIVHRDVKPGNIIIHPKGAAKLVDFGIAKLAGRELERQAAAAGTVAYMSPEQTHGEAAAPVTDIWSLGATLYEALTGRRPFHARAGQPLLEAIRHEAPEPLRRVRPEVPAALARIVERCLEKSPAARYPDGAALLDALGELPSPSRRSSRAARAVRYATAAAVVAALAGISYFATPGGTTPALDPQRVVVAPFENRTGQGALDPVGSMATDWIIQGLSHTGLVKVVPFTATLTSARYVTGISGASDTAEHLQALARESGAGIVISGAYYLQGDSLYLHGRITDAIAGRVLHAIEPASASTALPLAAVEALRQRVMAGLAPHLNPRISDYAGITSRTPSYEAYREYAAGMEHFIAIDWRGAIERFSRAAAHDSAYTLPLVLAAIAYANLGNYAAVDSIARLVEPRRDQLAEYDRLAITAATAWGRGDYQTSYRAAARVAQLAPNTIPHGQVALELLMLNRPRDALRVFAQLDPQRGELRGWPMYWENLTIAHHLLGQHRRERQVARRARDLLGDDPRTLRLELRALSALGRVTEVLRTLEDHLASPGEGSQRAGLLLRQTALELRAHGHAEAARQLFDRSLEWYLERPADVQATPGSRRALGEAYYLAERWAEAEQILRALATERPDDLALQGRLGTLAARQGNRAEAERISAWLAALERPYLLGEHTYWRARIAALLAERERAVALLRQAYTEGRYEWLDLHSDADLEPLRGYPPFRELLRPKG